MVWLDNARVSAIGAVLLLHTAAVVVLGSPVGSAYWWAGNGFDSLVRWCVPVFVMISGALLLDPHKNESLPAFYRKRVAKIVLPLLVWSLLYLLWGAAKSLRTGHPFTLGEMATRLLSGMPHYHMWFLFMIVPLYLFTPFFRTIIRSSSRRELAALMGFSFAIAIINNIHAAWSSGESRLFINWFLSFIPYFLLGYYIRTDPRQYARPLLFGVFLLASGATAVGCYLLAQRQGLAAGLYFYGYLSLTVIPMSVSMMYLLKTLTRPIGGATLSRTLSALTLGIYLIHPLVLESLQWLGFGPLDFHPAASIPLIAGIGFGTSWLGAWILSRLPYLRRII